MKRGLLLVVPLVLLATAGCPKNPRPLVFGKIDQERNAPLAARAKEESPALYAKAEGLRDKAEKAWEAGDTTAAVLYGEHAIAAYRHAIATGRLAAANARRAKESERLTKAKDRLLADEKSLAEVEREADKLDGDIAVRSEALAPAVSGPTTAAREAARWIATKVNLATAEALCEGANLLAPTAKGGAEARKVLSELAALVAKGDKTAPIDASTRARSLCLKALTSARDATVSGGGPSGDALFAEISGMGGYEPLRDERGVVATLSQVPAATAPFETGTSKLTKSGKDRIEALGRVAKTHPAFAVLVVVHGAPGTPNNPARDKERASQVKQTLAAAGAPLDKIGTQLAGSQLPAFDPSDVKAKARNERIEIIFVGGAK